MEAENVVLPDIEILVRAADFDVAVVAMFKRDEGGWDIVCGIQAPDDAAAISTALTEAAASVMSSRWQRLPAIRADDGRPF